MAVIRAFHLASVAVALASTPALALKVPQTMGAAASSDVVSVQRTVTGFDLQAVYYDGGQFMKQSGNAWVEQNVYGQSFSFVETARGETTVMLHDPSRGVFIQINLAANSIDIGEAGQSFQPLYTITGTEPGQVGRPASDPPFFNRVEYTCPEGLPLTVEYIEENGQSYVLYSIDGSPQARLDQQISGSGARYSNGADTIWSKGDTVLVELRGYQRQETCYER
ncbi:MAG: MliC family protein [Pseudomonadota bacterium]